MPKPSIGRVVHYVSHGTPKKDDGSQAYASECRAAIVTKVTNSTNVGLAVLNPSGMFFHESVLLDGKDDPAGGTWHWPERVEG